MKAVVTQVGVRCAEGVVLPRAEILEKGYPFKPPFVIKPTNEGSSVGVRLVQSDDDLQKIEEDGWIYCGSWMGIWHYFKRPVAGVQRPRGEGGLTGPSPCR